MNFGKLLVRIGNLFGIRTMELMLVNGLEISETCKRLIVDEALMNHFGVIVWAARISGVEKILLIGYLHQLFHIGRENLFDIYRSPSQIVNIIHTYCVPIGAP